MRFAVFDHNDATGRPPGTQLAERLSLIEAYERLGFYAYQMAEHHGTPLGIATPHLVLAAASQRTSTIRLGTLISILPLLAPMRMIEEAATIDQLTGGRLVLGVGRGISPAALLAVIRRVSSALKVRPPITGRTFSAGLASSAAWAQLATNPGAQ